MAQLTTDAAVLAKEAANFERIAGELKNVIARVESTAADLDNHWKGCAAQGARQAIRRFKQAADVQVAQLNDISTSIQTAGAQYSATDDERSAALASAMGMNGDNGKAHNGVQLVDWKQGPPRRRVRVPQAKMSARRSRTCPMARPRSSRRSTANKIFVGCGTGLLRGNTTRRRQLPRNRASAV